MTKNNKLLGLISEIADDVDRVQTKNNKRFFRKTATIFAAGAMTGALALFSVDSYISLTKENAQLRAALKQQTQPVGIDIYDQTPPMPKDTFYSYKVINNTKL